MEINFWKAFYNSYQILDQNVACGKLRYRGKSNEKGAFNTLSSIFNYGKGVDQLIIKCFRASQKKDVISMKRYFTADFKYIIRIQLHIQFY